MSQITFTAKFLSFDEWLDLNPDAETQDGECDDCEGTGFSECFHCGHEMECETCEGSGVGSSARATYEDQLRHDKKVLRKYQESLARDAEQAVGAVGADPSKDDGNKSAVTPEDTDGVR